MKILITGGNSSVALKLLKAFTTWQVILADYGEVPSFAATNYKFLSLGIKNEDTLAHTLLNNCLDEGVDAILPIHHFEIEAVAKSKVLFNEFSINVLLPDAPDLSKYVKAGINNKVNSWAVFKAGELIFSNHEATSVSEVGKKENLNGAFYFIAADQPCLITI